ncbi:hypothetical protein Tco_1370037 [Tanacetum coccineum]
MLGNPQQDLQEKGVIDSGCLRHMTRNMSYLTDFEEIDGGYLPFGRNTKGRKITSKDHLGKLRQATDEGFFVRKWTNVQKHVMMQSSPDAGFKPSGDNEKKVTEEPEKEGGDPSKEGERGDQEKDVDVNSTNSVYTVSSPVNTVCSPVNVVDLLDDLNMPPLEDIVYSDDDKDVGAEANMNNLDAFMPVSPIPTTRVHKDHPKNPKRYLKGPPKLGLWYPKDSPFDLVAYIDSDYAGASLDRKSTTRGCQFLRCRLISWQCKKQTVVANSTIEAEYGVALI